MNCINCGTECNDLMYVKQPENSTEKWCVLCGDKEEKRSVLDDEIVPGGKRVRPARYMLDSTTWKKPHMYEEKPFKSDAEKKKVHPKAQAGQIMIQMPQVSSGAILTMKKQQTQVATQATKIYQGTPGISTPVPTDPEMTNEEEAHALVDAARLVKRIYDKEENDGTDHGTDTVQAMEAVKNLYLSATGEELDFDAL